MALRDETPPDYVSESPALRVDRDGRREDRPMIGRAHLLWPFAAPYVALWEQQVTAHIVAPDADLLRYKLVIAPFLHVLRPEVVDNLRRYVEAGGALVLGPRSGFKDEYNRLFPTPQPGPLADLAGATVRFFDSLEPDRLNVLRWEHMSNMHRTEVGLWAEVLDPEEQGTEVLASYVQGWYANEAAITRKKHAGGGQVILVGCMGGPTLYDNLLRWLLPQLRITPLMAPVSGVEVWSRADGTGRRVVFLLNHTGSVQHITLAHPVTDVLTGQAFTRNLALKAGQVIVYEEQANHP